MDESADPSNPSMEEANALNKEESMEDKTESAPKEAVGTKPGDAPEGNDFAVDEESGLGVKKVVDEDDVGPTSMNPVEAADPPSAEELTNAIIEEAAAVAANPPESDEHANAEQVLHATVIESTNEKPTSSKKKSSKPMKKVLVAKKESDLAMNFLNGKRDLADTLTEKDCLFLGRKFWVFTHEQLKYLLKQASGEVSPPEGQTGGSFLSREDILSRIETSDIAGPQAGTDAVKMDVDNKNDAETGEAMDVDPKPSEKNATADEGPEAGETRRAAAEAKLREWNDKLSNAPEKSSLSVQESFSLSGAMTALLTRTVRNFLETVDIKTLLSFMALKKTETGAICEILLTWRTKCGLPPVTHLGIAKYLLGVNARIETALSAIPPVEEDKRHWMMDPIIVMTGAAREFLVEDQKLLTAFDFIHTRTKDLSLALADWREKKGFVPLKGSGKVAMISGWKATAKEVLEVEAGVGKVLVGGDLEGIVLADIPGGPNGAPISHKKHVASTASRPSHAVSHALMEPLALKLEEATPPARIAARESMEKAKKRLSSARRQSDYDLHSKLFLDEMLGEEETDVLASVHIHTTAQLLEADEEDRESLASEMVAAGLVDQEEESKALVEKWIKSLKEKLNITDDYAPPRKKAKSVEKKKRDSEAREEKEKPTPSSPKSKKTKSHHKVLKPESTQDVEDPFELLSAITKKFLRGIGITNAEQFLTSRTTDIASEFVTFRKTEGMA